MNIYHNQVTDVCGSVTVRGNIDHASNRVRIRESNKIVMFLWDDRLFLIHIIEVVFVITHGPALSRLYTIYYAV